MHPEVAGAVVFRPMAYDFLDLTIRDGVAHLELNRPDAANGIDIGLATDLRDATYAITVDSSVRAVLLTGAGPRFCGGGDVKAFAAAGSDLPSELRRTLNHLHAAIAQLIRGDALVVAAVHGAAAGAGMGLVGAADYVVTGESVKFVMAYTSIGLTPDGSSSWFLPRTVGLKRAIELTVLNRALTAPEALDWGLVNEVVPDDDVKARGAAVAAKLAAGPVRAFAEAKRLLHTSFEHSLEQHLAEEAEAIATAAADPESAEGIAAFVEKRKPDYTAC